jgi:hypothetical protein
MERRREVPGAVTKKYNPATGQEETTSVAAEKTAGDIEDAKATAKMSTTAGADLEGVARRAKATGTPVEETDPDKMSPLARMAYLNKKRKASSAGAAGDALAGRSQ